MDFCMKYFMFSTVSTFSNYFVPTISPAQFLILDFMFLDMIIFFFPSLV
jgi:hypothetical protein